MLFLKHINTSVIMNIIVRFLNTIDDYQMKKRALEWINKLKIIEKIIELLNHAYTSEVHSNASKILCDIVLKSREKIVKVAANENDLLVSTVYEANPLLSAIEE